MTDRSKGPKEVDAGLDKRVSIIERELSTVITNIDNLGKQLDAQTLAIDKILFASTNANKPNWMVILTLLALLVTAGWYSLTTIMSPVKEDIANLSEITAKLFDIHVDHIKDGHPKRVEALVAANTKTIDENKKEIQREVDYKVSTINARLDRMEAFKYDRESIPARLDLLERKSQ